MESKEILEEMEMNYDEFVSYLLKKYGPAKYDYFTNATCKTKSKRISRTKEGLFCHHIDEDKGYMLSHTGCALEQPFEYQKAERLVYCNYIEHLLLHILIGKNAFWSKHQKLIAPKQFSYFIVPGVSYICSEINLLYDQNGSSVEWRNRCFKVSAKYCYAAHESRLHQNDRCKRFTLCLVLTVRFRSLAPWGKLFQLFI